MLAANETNEEETPLEIDEEEILNEEEILDEELLMDEDDNFFGSSPDSGRCDSQNGGIEKRHKCDICNKAFPYMSILESHKRCHTGEVVFYYILYSVLDEFKKFLIPLKKLQFWGREVI